MALEVDKKLGEETMSEKGGGADLKKGGNDCLSTVSSPHLPLLPPPNG